jgi:TolB protein
VPKLLKYIFISILLFSANSYAALNLESIPIAVMSFSTHHNIAQIISSDLQNSGRFQVKNINAPQQLSYGVHAVNYAYWAEQKINNVVLGSVASIRNKYKVNFRLLDVSSRSMLLNKSYKIPKKELRTLAHRISDLIYQQLIGIRGIFSTKIAYVLVERTPGKLSKYSLIVAEFDGHNPKQLFVSSEPIMSPAWSPDGKKIAYVSFEHKKAAIYIQNVATKKRTIITNFPGINGAPAWSPDGKKLVVVLTKTSYPKFYIIDLVTKQLEQITFGRSLDTEPNWAPDGQSIIFTSNRNRSPQIYQLDLVAKKVRRITYQGDYNARASFTPDGKSIVMLHHDDDVFNIARQNLSSGEIDILTKSGMNESPSIAPNGRMVIYATNDNGRGVLDEISIDGKARLRLTSEKGDVQEPAWSPFLN